MIRRVYSHCVAALAWILDFGTKSPDALDHKGKLASTITLVALFLGGAAGWYFFMHGGDIYLDIHDWGQVTSPRAAFLQDAVRTGQPPLHMESSAALMNLTDRFLAMPDSDVFPLVLILRWTDLGSFMLWNVLFFYALGFLGLLALRRKFNLSVAAFGLLFLLLFFNGHLSDHIAVGHENWTAHFLLPFFAYLVFELLDSPFPWRWSLKFCLLTLAFLLQGEFHLYVTCLFFLGILALVKRERLRLIVGASFLSGLVGMIRLLPPILIAGKFDTAFLAGFSNVGEMFDGLTKLVPPVKDLVFNISRTSPLGWWEVDYYIGGLGALALVYFGIYMWIRRRRMLQEINAIAAPILLLGILSVGRLYDAFHFLRIPILDSERVATRLLVLPLLFLVVMAARNFQAFLDTHKSSWIRAGAILGLAGVAAQLGQHFVLWRVAKMPNLFPHKAVDLIRRVANHPDPPYVTLVVVGLVVSTVSLTFIAWMALAERRHQHVEIELAGREV